MPWWLFKPALWGSTVTRSTSLSVTAVLLLQRCSFLPYLYTWSSILIIISQYDDVILLYREGEKAKERESGGQKEKERAQEKKTALLLLRACSSCLWHVLQIQTLKPWWRCVWCQHDCVQVVFRSIFAENSARVTVKIGKSLNLPMKCPWHARWKDYWKSVIQYKYS